MVSIEIDSEACIGCGTCAEQCPNQVFTIIDEKANVASIDSCMVCHLCETICPKMAICVKE